MNGYPVHEKCGGLLMMPAAVGMPLPDGACGVVFCTTCFPKVGLIAPDSSAFVKARDASRAAGVVDVPGELGAGHVGPAGRLALHHAVCGNAAAARRKRTAFALCKALLLLDDEGCPTTAGRELAARIGLSADVPPRAPELEQFELPIDLTLRKRDEAAAAILAEPAPAPPAAMARPVLRWCGGKGDLLDGIIPALPAEYGRLFVPFVGGGALVFALSGRVAYMSDANTHLINAYVCIRDSVDDVIAALQEHKSDDVYYYPLRDSFNEGYGDPIWRAAAFIYMNRVCFNGVCRYNRNGEFNVPWGKNVNATICDANNLRACSAALRDATIEAADFRAVETMAQPGDCLYLDPPYLPESKTASFTGYWGKWDDQDHEDVAAVFRRLAARGVHVLASNSDTPKARALYDGFEMRTLSRANSINSKASARGGKTELLILGGTWTPRGAT